MKRISIILSFSGLIFTFAHEAHHPKTLEIPKQEKKLQKINEAYIEQVKPIFQSKCFDCHSSSTKYPWYYSLPMIRRKIDEDIAEAKKHLDFNHNFPFQGHGSPEEDLKAIAEVIQKGSMPPFRYRILHWNSRLTTSEKEKIMLWVLNSERLLLQ